MANFSDDKSALDALRSQHEALLAEVSKVIVGQDQVIREVTTAIFAGGHILLVGVPGLAKTLLVNTVAQALGLSFNRIQFTPDLMPGSSGAKNTYTIRKTSPEIEKNIFAHGAYLKGPKLGWTTQKKYFFKMVLSSSFGNLI